jgi:hypothetical protein
VSAFIRVRYDRPTPFAVASFVLALLTTAATVYVAWSWAPADASQLLPSEQELRLAIFAAAALSLSLTVVSFLAMRASRPLAEPGPRPQPRLGPPSTTDTKV